MQFVRSRIAVSRLSESKIGRSVEKQLGWFSASEDLCDFSAAELRIRGQSPSKLVSAAKSI